MWSYVSPEARVPQDHPLRPIRQMVDVVLTELSPRFAPLYATTGRPSIAPEKLLRALLQVLYTVRSERLLMEQLDYNLLFRWFVGLEMDDPGWDHSVFTKDRERGAGPGAPSAPALERAFHRGRHADRGVGRAQELQENDGHRQPDGEIPGRSPQQRDAYVDD